MALSRMSSLLSTVAWLGRRPKAACPMLTYSGASLTRRLFGRRSGDRRRLPHHNHNNTSNKKFQYCNGNRDTQRTNEDGNTKATNRNTRHLHKGQAPLQNRRAIRWRGKGLKHGHTDEVIERWGWCVVVLVWTDNRETRSRSCPEEIKLGARACSSILRLKYARLWPR
jgi:hypothetical protein